MSILARVSTQPAEPPPQPVVVGRLRDRLCDAAGGRFHERIYGWMGHADLVATPQGPRIDWSGAMKHEGH